MAHALAHLLLDRAPQARSVGTISYPVADDPVERRANAFAPAFLAPPSWLKAAHGRDGHAILVSLIEHWSFSVEGVAWHVKNIVGWSEAETRAAMQQHARRSGPVHEASPERLHHAILEGAAPQDIGLISDAVIRSVEEG